MIQVAPKVRDLAQWLLTQETGESKSLEAGANAVSAAIEKLRQRLSKLVGVIGFQALLARALALAKAEIPGLKSVRVNPDGTLEGFSEMARQQEADETTKAGMSLLAQLLGLLVTLIGGVLTLRLVQDVWPDASLEYLNLSVEETP